MRLADFAGNWRIARLIDDRAGGRQGALNGTARLTRAGDGLIYTETGVLRFDGQPGIRAQQIHRWTPDGAAIRVDFADGRPFHRLSLAGASHKAHHDCPPDSYLVRYDFATWPDWTTTWTVHGPQKDYTMITRYVRAGDDGG